MKGAWSATGGLPFLCGMQTWKLWSRIPEVAEDLVEDTYFPLDIVGVPPTWDGHQVTVPQALLVCASGHASPSLGAGMKEDPMPHSEVNHGRVFLSTICGELHSLLRPAATNAISRGRRW